MNIRTELKYVGTNIFGSIRIIEAMLFIRHGTSQLKNLIITCAT